MGNSTNSPKRRKGDILEAARKYKAKNKIPLLVHATRRWGRKINGRILYYGPVDGKLPDFGASNAIEEYHRVVEDDRAGRARRPKDSELITLQDATNLFLTAKAALRDTGELAPRTWSDYHATCSRVIDILGKHRAVADLDPADFRKLRASFAAGRGPVSLATDVRRARVFFRFCYTEELIDRPCRYGTAFDLPSPKTQRLARAAKGVRMFEGCEIRRLLDASDPIMRGMILLGVNCGFGQTDISGLPVSAIDFRGGWIDFGREKTGVPRKCPVWGETAAALRDAIAMRPEPSGPEHAELAFLTPTGIPVVRNWLSTKEEKAKAGLTTRTDTVARAFTRLVKSCGLNGSRSFYTLRHTFATVAEETGDYPAVSSIMGHSPRGDDMSAVYREKIGDDRLLKVTNYVRTWLWPPEDDHDADGEGGKS